MTELLQALAPFVPYPLIRRALADPGAPTAPTEERFPAAVLFADVSGFTPLTESLSRKGAEGPEELTRLLNRYFGRIIALIEAEGGEVVKFGGDAVIVIFPATASASTADCYSGHIGHAVRRALQSAEAIQAAMAEFATLETSIGTISLGIKIGIGAGEILSMQIGGVGGHWEYIIAGDPLRQVAEAEGRAKRGDIILSPEAAASIHSQPLSPCPLVPPDWSVVEDPAAVVDSLRCYVPAPVLSSLDRGLYDWLAVLRPMSVLFIGVQGPDYEQSEAVQHLHTFLRFALGTIDRYQGVLSRLSIDDKGTVLLVLFGAPPFSHEDDPVRAVRCALDLQALTTTGPLRDTSFQLAIGVTTGHVFAGPVGGKTRREYTVMGNAANLAARLMVKAKGALRGEGIVCDRDTHHQAKEQIEFESLLPMRAKGRRGVTYIYRPTAELAVQRLEARILHPLVGREDELARLEVALAAVEAGENRVLLIEGDAGIGKSRLVSELARLVQERGLNSLQGAGRSTERQTPYRAWRDILVSYFDLGKPDPVGGSQDDLGERQFQVQRLVQEIAPDQVPRLPLLNDLLNLSFAETELTAALDPALRQQSLTALLLTLLRARARERPLILILEDAQWMDSLSWELAVYGARALSTSGDPLLLVLVTRPLEAKSLGAEHLSTLGLLVDVETIALAPLGPEEIVAMVAARFDLPEDALPEPLAKLVQQRAQGNPFFAEQLVLTLRDQKTIRIEPDPARREDPSGRAYRCLIVGDLEEAGRTLPDTVQGLILDRIDRLPPEQQLVLRVASVIGSPFAYRPLDYTMQEHTWISKATLKSDLENLAALDLTPLHTLEPDLAYIFRNFVTREVAYETLLFAQRRALHRTVAEWYESTFRSQLSALRAFYPLLVHHYHHAGDVEREQHYAKLAGDQAAAQFANTEAIAYLSRALELTPEADMVERYAFLLARERVYDVQGAREAQRGDLEALQRLAEVEQEAAGPISSWAGLVAAIRRAEVTLRQAHYAQVTGDYMASVMAAREAINLVQVSIQAAAQEAANAPLGLKAARLEAAGYLQWGRTLWRRGLYEIAQEWLERALVRARAVEEPRIEADSLRSLGTVCWHLVDYARAKDYVNQALQIYRRLGDRRGESAALNDLGLVSLNLRDPLESRSYYLQALQIRREIGDRRGEGISLHSLGLAHSYQGDYVRARSYLKQAWRIHREIADRRGEGVALHMLGNVCRHLGDYAGAESYYEQALHALQEIDDPQHEGLVLASQSLLKGLLQDHRPAHEYGRQALLKGQEEGDRHLQGYAWTALGHALVGLGSLAEAAIAYDNALVLRRGLHEHHLAIELLAGLARVSLARGCPEDVEQARAWVEEILSYLERDTLDGADEPLRVYMTCYRVLLDQQDPRARGLLIGAYSLLQKWAAGIENVDERRRFFQVASHREIVRERMQVVRRYARLLRGSASELEL